LELAVNSFAWTTTFSTSTAGRCGTPLKVKIADLHDARFISCEACASKPPFNPRQVFVVFEQDTQRDEEGKRK
jgi:hypothetical protein